MRHFRNLFLYVFFILILTGCAFSKNQEFSQTENDGSEKNSSSQEVSGNDKLAFQYQEKDQMKDIFLTNISEDGTLSLWNMIGKIRITNLSTDDFEYSDFSLNLEYYKNKNWYVCDKRQLSPLEGLNTYICRARESSDLHFSSYDWFSLSPGHYRLVLTDPIISEYEEPDPNETYYWTAIEFDLTNNLPETPKNSDEDLIPAFEKENSAQNSDILLQISEPVFADNSKLGSI